MAWLKSAFVGCQGPWWLAGHQGAKKPIFGPKNLVDGSLYLQNLYAADGLGVWALTAEKEFCPGLALLALLALLPLLACLQ